MKVAELIADAYRNCGLDTEEEPTPAEYSQGLRRLNSMLNAWSAEKLNVYGIVSGISSGGYALTAGEAAYTLGTGNDVQSPTVPSSAPVTMTESGQVDSSADTIFVNADVTDIVVTLQPAITGRDVSIMRIDNSANTVSIVPIGADTINGGTDYQLSSQWAGATFKADGVSTWGIF